ncbi:MAG: zinc ribbon domain-containing protein [Burkholderiales bacterium]|nr:zinc ribbon domain-containing protein [Burkholderiales bacterium]
MPIYEYRCSKCGFQKEYLQRLNEAPLTKCPECGKRSFTKMVTAAGFQLKGTGWYATDFRHGGKSKPAEKSGEPAAKDAPAKQSGSKESATKESATKEGAAKDSSKSDSGGRGASSATSS